MVGHAFCKKLVSRDLNKSFQVVVLGEENSPAYDRVNLTKYMNGTSAEELELAPVDWYQTHALQLITGDPVIKVDRAARSVETVSGAVVKYDYLVLATGSRPYVPAIEGISETGVFVYRTLDDVRAIYRYSTGIRSAAVLGGGLLGLEAAKALFDLGLETHVIEMAAGLMPRQLDANASNMLKQKIEKLGVTVHLEKRTDAIGELDSQRVLKFDHGPPLPVDMVVVSAGIRARDELARDCGLEIGSRGGVVIDNQLCTSDPYIYAIGECACHDNTIYGLVAPGYRMADLLAERFSGGDVQFQKGDQSARLKLLGVDVGTLGEPLSGNPKSMSLAWKDEGSYRKLILLKGKVVGAMSVGDWSEMEHIQQLLATGQGIWWWNLARFRWTGRLWRDGSIRRVSDWPDHSIVCSCMQVTKGSLSTAIINGFSEPRQLVLATGASTVCGSCEPLICELANTASVRQFWGAAVEKPRQPLTAKWLLGASIVALLGLFLWLFGPLPYADSVQSAWYRIDVIWRDTFIRQITGYTLLGISVLAALISLRKRWQWLSFGSVAMWRAIHATIGVMTLLGLAVHTGMSTGTNFNFLLALVFLGINLLGIATGIAASLENHVSGNLAITIRTWRPRFNKLHIWLFLPLPILLVIHIACVYYY